MQQRHWSLADQTGIPVLPLLAVWPWARYLTSLSFSFLTSKMGMIIVSTS